MYVCTCIHMYVRVCTRECVCVFVCACVYYSLIPHNYTQKTVYFQLTTLLRLPSTDLLQGVSRQIVVYFIIPHIILFLIFYSYYYITPTGVRYY
jgi:hypothetical protein